MATMFLQEVEASVLVADVRDFVTLAAQLGPVELGLALSLFYEHIGEVVEAERGRLIKFMGDGVLALFVGGPQIDHAARALAAVARATRTREAFLEKCVAEKSPRLDYAVGVASGLVLAGEMGTQTLRYFDVLGQPVNHAFRLTALATRRGVPNLVAAATYEGAAKDARPPAVETDVIELDAQRLRLFRVD